jgi:hypothetical protein
MQRSTAKMREPCDCQQHHMHHGIKLQFLISLTRIKNAAFFSTVFTRINNLPLEECFKIIGKKIMAIK